MKLNEKQIAKVNKISEDAGLDDNLGPACNLDLEDVKVVKEARKLLLSQAKALDKILAIIAPPKAPPAKIGGLGSA
jgi:hypothetical protein